MNPKFDLFFFKSFNIVFNALDNVKARQYVNSMCVLANVPLIEGGSTGLLVRVILLFHIRQNVIIVVLEEVMKERNMPFVQFEGTT